MTNLAVLIQDDAQLRALEDINSALEELRLLNETIKSPDPYAIRVSKKQFLTVDEILSARIETVLRIQRDRRAKEIVTKALKFRIALDENERQLLEEVTVTVPHDE